MEEPCVIRLGDLKTSLEFLIVDCKTGAIIDITDTTVTIRFKFVDGSEIEKLGVIYTGGINGNGTDGIAQYIVLTGFFIEKDIGLLQGIAIAEFPDGSKFHSSPANFLIMDNFE